MIHSEPWYRSAAGLSDQLSKLESQVVHEFQSSGQIDPNLLEEIRRLSSRLGTPSKLRFTLDYAEYMQAVEEFLESKAGELNARGGIQAKVDEALDIHGPIVLHVDHLPKYQRIVQVWFRFSGEENFEDFDTDIDREVYDSNFTDPVAAEAAFMRDVETEQRYKARETFLSIVREEAMSSLGAGQGLAEAETDDGQHWEALGKVGVLVSVDALEMVTKVGLA